MLSACDNGGTDATDPVLIPPATGWSNPLPAFGSALDDSLTAAPNPYDATATGAELPILIPAEYPGASLRR